MELRPTTKNDLIEVIKIINQAKQYFKNEGIDQWQDGYPNEDSIINDINQHEAYVLENNGKILADVYKRQLKHQLFQTLLQHL